MQLGKTLIGAIIGAAAGIGVLVAVYLLAGRDDVWMSIPVAILTGLGVRMIVSTSGHASYLRGALTLLIALGAYFGGLAVTQAVANQRASEAKKPHTPAAVEGEKADADKTDEPGAEAPPPPQAPPQAAPRLPEEARAKAQLPRQLNTWDFISLAIAALVAYELGRGTGGVRRDATVAAPGEPVPAGTHPDA
jgi:hypothetical protein